MKNEQISWDTLNTEVIACRKCERLVEWREKVAREKRRAYSECDYWGKPVPGFGDKHAQVMILGLAPGAHGSNRTGRMFTGDASGDFLFPALHQAMFASQPIAVNVHDGMTLNNIYITAVCRCAPPGNKPLREEQENCLTFLQTEIALLSHIKGIVALGSIAFRAAFDLLKENFGIDRRSRPKFTHNTLYTFPESPVWLLAAYHPSRQNTQTGRLTKEMFASVWKRVNQLIS